MGRAAAEDVDAGAVAGWDPAGSVSVPIAEPPRLISRVRPVTILSVPNVVRL